MYFQALSYPAVYRVLINMIYIINILNHLPLSRHINLCHSFWHDQNADTLKCTLRKLGLGLQSVTDVQAGRQSHRQTGIM